MSKRRTFNEDFKREAVELTGQHGITTSQVGRDIGVGVGLLGHYTDVFDYIERFHNPRMQRRLDSRDQKFIALTQLPAETG